MQFDGAAIARSAAPADCPFCHPHALAIILTRTEHFFLLVDHAPLLEGHLLIVPHAHYPCYGAVPAALDAELLSLKARVSAFLEEAYRRPVFFEHGVFHQTVFHAHLHAFPFGPVDLDLTALAAPEGRAVRTQADIRAWYEGRGPYFYLGYPAEGDIPGDAAIFPPDDAYYRRALGMLRRRSSGVAAWEPPVLRRAFGGEKMRAVADAWRRFENRKQESAS